MKINKIIFFILLCVVSIFIFTNKSYAYDNSKVGKVEFTEDAIIYELKTVGGGGTKRTEYSQSSKKIEKGTEGFCKEYITELSEAKTTEERLRFNYSLCLVEVEKEGGQKTFVVKKNSIKKLEYESGDFGFKKGDEINFIETSYIYEYRQIGSAQVGEVKYDYVILYNSKDNQPYRINKDFHGTFQEDVGAKYIKVKVDWKNNGKPEIVIVLRKNVEIVAWLDKKAPKEIRVVKELLKPYLSEEKLKEGEVLWAPNVDGMLEEKLKTKEQIIGNYELASIYLETLNREEFKANIEVPKLKTMLQLYKGKIEALAKKKGVDILGTPENIRKQYANEIGQDLEKVVEDKVRRATVNTQGDIYYQPDKVGKDTTSEETIDDLIGNAQDFTESAKDGAIGSVEAVELQDFSKVLYNILLSVGVAAAVIVGAILGIKIMTAGVEEKAEVKELLIPYVVACVIIFGGFGIWKLVVEILSGV